MKALLSTLALAMTLQINFTHANDVDSAIEVIQDSLYETGDAFRAASVVSVYGAEIAYQNTNPKELALACKQFDKTKDTLDSFISKEGKEFLASHSAYQRVIEVCIDSSTLNAGPNTQLANIFYKLANREMIKELLGVIY